MDELMDQASFIPADMLRRLLGNGMLEAISPYLDRALLEPAEALIKRPSKHFRAHLLYAAYEIASLQDQMQQDATTRLKICAQAVELLHAGSLIVDDIQDGSLRRRGGSSIHLLYGMPGALCAGNWLYFVPLRLFRSLELPADRENLLYRLYHEALERAHCGQALDLNVRIDELRQADVPALCESIIDLKTGSITSLAMALGALIADADESWVRALGEFGRRFGSVLQIYDDLGNVIGCMDVMKRFEDLTKRKPSGIWGVVARMANERDYQLFVEAAFALPNDEALIESWVDHHELAIHAVEDARRRLESAFDELKIQLGVGENLLCKLRELGGALTHAYH